MGWSLWPDWEAKGKKEDNNNKSIKQNTDHRTESGQRRVKSSQAQERHFSNSTLGRRTLEKAKSGPHMILGLYYCLHDNTQDNK